MIDDTNSKDDQSAEDESSAHRLGTRTGVGKTDRLIELAAATHAEDKDEDRPGFIDPKASNDDPDEGGEPR